MHLRNWKYFIVANLYSQISAQLLTTVNSSNFLKPVLDLGHRQNETLGYFLFHNPSYSLKIYTEQFL